MKAAAKRCAIYTRKSTEEGLDQAFNSLHAQREACEAYVLSQAGEGWAASPKLYDDGGFSGGNMDRPALATLLADIDAGRIDIVVVYKVDRLTRSLADFAKIVERLDKAGASFVSVTQAFNTTNSMGRLTLNVLLSFAQFEREVTSERIRDKIALSKAKGMWMGGAVPLGYDVIDRKLIVNSTEAETVRQIFRRYLEVRSVHALREELQRQGVRSKARTTHTGKLLGGGVINRGAVFRLLQNRLYLGEVSHKGKHYPGEHPAIVDAALFDAVQEALKSNRAARGGRSINCSRSLLVGKIFDAEGAPMTPTFSYGRGGKPYRYYVSAALQTGGASRDGTTLVRLGADAVEAFLAEQMSRITGADAQDLTGVIARIEVSRDETQVVFQPPSRPGAHPTLLLASLKARLEPGEAIVWEDEARSHVRVRLPLRLKLRGGRTWLDGDRYVGAPAKKNKSLIHGLKTAHRALAKLDVSPLTSPEDFVSATAAPTCPHQRRLSVLTFLSPDQQRLIVEGRQPKGIDLSVISGADVPLAWADQASWLSSRAS